MLIRDATEADLPAIVEIYNTAVATRISTAQLEPVTIESRRYWLTKQDLYPFWVADLDGTIAGWLSFKEFLPRAAYRHTAEISVYVGEKFRRLGIGRQLLKDAIRRAPEYGLSSLVGLIFAHNTPSIALFGEAAFERWGILPGVAQLDDDLRDLTIFGRKV